MAYSVFVIDQHNINQEVSLHQKPANSKKRESIKVVLGVLAVILIAPVITLTIVVFVFQSYRVDGPSMEETLHNNDRLIVNKLPKTWAKLTGSDYIPDRQTIIIFQRSESIGLNNYGDRQLIKRVIGIPGDRVVVKDNKVTIYNEQNPDGYNPDQGTDYKESIGMIGGNVDVTIDEDEVFVMGDNRDNSLDSRVFGPIKSKDIIGTLAVRIYPFNKLDAF